MRATSKMIAAAAEKIRRGEVVAFPTETVYGLGANALDADAVRRIFKAKGRPSDNPLIVHIADESMLKSLVARVPRTAKALMKRFWPGPLTIVFARSAAVPDEVTAGLDTVAVRMPAHEIALELIRASGVPIAAPSANRSGRPSPTTAAHVREDFARLTILDGGPAQHGVESTVIAVDGTPRVLRVGAITLEQLREVVPGIERATHLKHEPPPSPGMKYRHYAPTVPLIVFGPRKLEALKIRAQWEGTVVLCPARYVPDIPMSISLGDTDEAIAANLFDLLRRDWKGVRELLVLGVPRRGLGTTIMDRLEKAATEIV
jgi:L-threonylcarbamoyladenylate synthase